MSRPSGLKDVLRLFDTIPLAMSELITHSTQPLNAEPKPQDLVKNDVTPIDLFYHRNHGPVPRDAEAAVQQGHQAIDSWEVCFEAEDGVLEGNPGGRRVTLKQLKDKYDTVEEDIALQVRCIVLTLRDLVENSVYLIVRRE